MIKKGMNALLLLCILLVCNGKSSAMEKEGNKYYAYGTGGTTKGEGFACFSSDDLKNWKREGQALSAADSYGKWGFWAPEVYYIESKKKFYMFYSVEEHICVATSDSPVGPFRQEVKQPVWEH